MKLILETVLQRLAFLKLLLHGSVCTCISIAKEIYQPSFKLMVYFTKVQCVSDWHVTCMEGSLHGCYGNHS